VYIQKGKTEIKRNRIRGRKQEQIGKQQEYHYVELRKGTARGITGAGARG